MKRIFLFFTLLAGLAATAQKINNTLRFEKGKKLELEYSASTESSGMGNAKMEVSLVRSFDVEDIVEGNAVIEHKVKRIQFNLESMMANEKFDSENEGDRNSDIGKALEKTLKGKYIITLDATGKVITVIGNEDDKDKQLSAEDQMILGIIERLAGGVQPPAAGESSVFSILPAREIKAGEKWTDSTATRTTNYTLQSISDDEILLQYDEIVNAEEQQETNGVTITMKTNDRTTGEIRLDRNTGILKEKTANTESEGTMSVMGQSMPMKSSTVKKWKVK